MKIDVVRPFFLAGKPKPIGAVLDLPNGLAMDLIGMRKAIGHVEDAADKPAARHRKAKPVAADPAQQEPAHPEDVA